MHQVRISYRYLWFPSGVPTSSGTVLAASRAGDRPCQAWRRGTRRRRRCHRPFLRPHVTEGEKTRLTAWSRGLRAVHDRLREGLRVTRTALEDGTPAEPASRELLLFCRGFCTALAAHHAAADSELFPAGAAARPELRAALRDRE